MTSIVQSLRSLGRSPGFTAVVVLSLGLGIGACTSVFSVLNAFLFVPLPYREAERLVELQPTQSPTTNRLAGDGFMRTRVDRWISSGMRSFEALGWESQETLRLDGADGGERLSARVVSGTWFEMLGVEALRGRLLIPEDDATGEPVVVLSEQLWRERFGGSSDILGQNLRISGIQVTVVGVVSERVLGGRSVWLPASARPADQRPFIVTTVARLAPGVTLAAAQSELSVVTAAEVAADPVGSVGYGAMPRALVELTRRTDRGALWLALGLAGATLMMALTNLMTLFLIRAARRSQIAAIRIALGAGLSQLGRGLVAEGLILGSAGAALGLLIGNWGRHAITKLLGTQYSLDYAPPMDWRVFAFATGLSMTCALLLALEPLRALRVIDVRSLLQRSGAATANRGDMRSRHAVVAVQIAAAVVVVLGAVFTTVRAQKYFNIDLGYDAERIVVAVPDYRSAGLARASRPEIASSMVARLQGRPGVAAAGAWYQSAQQYPPRPEYNAVVEGFAGRGPGYFYGVSPEFMEFVGAGATIVRGRDFTAEDGPGAPQVAIVSEDAARNWWPGQDPLGKQIKLGQDAPWATVVGVSSDMAFLNEAGLLQWNARRMIREAGRESSGSVGPQLFRPLAQVPTPPMGWSEGCAPGCSGLEIGARASGDANLAAQSLAAAVAEVSPTAPPIRLGTVTELQADHFRGRQITLNRTLAGSTAAITVLLAVLGVVGVVTDGITRRTREIGIRVALGAKRHHVVRSVASDSLVSSGIGLVLGIGSVVILRGVLTKALDPMSLLGRCTPFVGLS